MELPAIQGLTLLFFVFCANFLFFVLGQEVHQKAFLMFWTLFIFSVSELFCGLLSDALYSRQVVWALVPQNTVICPTCGDLTSPRRCGRLYLSEPTVRRMSIQIRQRRIEARRMFFITLNLSNSHLKRYVSYIYLVVFAAKFYLRLGWLERRRSTRRSATHVQYCHGKMVKVKHRKHPHGTL